MRIIVCENYEEMSKQAAKLVAAQVNLKPNCVLGLATGSTPVGMYRELIKMYNEKELDFSEVTSFNLDEYYPIDSDNVQSYHHFMNQNLFNEINIKNTNILDGKAVDPQKECEEFEKKIEAAGGIDLQILGIGINGHIGFNEPDSTLHSLTHLTSLTQSTIEANSRFFDTIDEVPTHALTMGIGTILKSRKIILMANGKNKHDAISGLLHPEISTELPATLLNVHSDIVIICDKEAYNG